MLGGVFDAIRRLISWEDSADPGGYIPVLPPHQGSASSSEMPSNVRRNWSSINIDEESAFQLASVYREHFAILPAEWSESMNEATTKCNLIEPLLRTMGWMPLLCERSIYSGVIPDYQNTGRTVALEAKAAKSLYNDISALNPTSAYKDIADQVATYLGDKNIRSIIYTNGRNWWRFEKDDDAEKIHALRFDLHTASNLLKNNPKNTRDISNFLSLFHARSFDRGVNGSTSIHVGRVVEYKTCSMFLKDLNRGLG
jgi:hypothetical protein